MNYDEALNIWYTISGLVKKIARAAEDTGEDFKDAVDDVIETSDVRMFYEGTQNVDDKAIFELLQVRGVADALLALSGETDMNSNDGNKVMGAYWNWMEAQKALFQESINNFDWHWGRTKPSDIEDFRQTYYDRADAYVEASENLQDQLERIQKELD